MTLANLYSKDGQQEKVFVTYEKALEAAAQSLAGGQQPGLFAFFRQRHSR